MTADTRIHATGNMREDTRKILKVASCIEIVGLLCAAAVWSTGGLNVHGAHGNLGWFGLVVAAGCLPIGTFFLLLGVAKWMGDRNRTD
jgi:hypothetical protein